MVISVCLFVGSIITREPFDRFASNFDWKNLVDLRKCSLLCVKFLINLNGKNKLGFQVSIYVYKVVISVCLSDCLFVRS